LRGPAHHGGYRSPPADPDQPGSQAEETRLRQTRPVRPGIKQGEAAHGPRCGYGHSACDKTTEAVAEQVYRLTTCGGDYYLQILREYIH
jgi:hypothetical protein